MLAAACSQDRQAASTTSSVVYDVDVAPILQAHCVECHGASAPAAGWSASSFLTVIACVQPSNAPATISTDGRTPILSALNEAPHVGLLAPEEEATLRRWLQAGAPAYQASVHDPGIIDPRSAGFHGALLRASHWSPMLDGTSPGACGRCHDGAPARPAGVTLAAPLAPSCTSCHSQPGGVLACSTCHGSGALPYPPRDPCFFAGGPFEVGGAHARHAQASPIRSTGLPCSTCHPPPGSAVIGGLHGDGIVEVAFDASLVPGTASYDGTTGACSVSCHQQGGRAPHVVWTEAGALVTCNDCHLSPPANHYRGACSGCHAEANAAGTALTPGPLHINGKVDLGDGSGECGACHGTGPSPWPSTAAHPAHRAPAIALPLACSSCHVVPATVLDPVHLDGTVHVAFSGLATARGASPSCNGTTCSSVACHGAQLADPAAVPAWDDPSAAQAKCGSCHGIPPTQHTPSASCDRTECHGAEVSLSADGLPMVTAAGRSLHIDGVVEPAR